jgi:Protein of unknown function (DUF551)
MRWISVEEDLPYEAQNCWVYGFLDPLSLRKSVFEGYFLSDPIIPNCSVQNPRWIYNESLNAFVIMGLVTHWMPYFKPEPPSE